MLLILIFSIFSSFINAQTWIDDQPFNELGFQLGVESQMFNTKSNYNGKGNEQDLLANRSYKLMSGRIWAAMDWQEQMRIYASAGYAQATSSNGITDGEQTGSGLTDVEARAYWESGFRPWIFRPYGRFAFPIQRVGLNTRTPIYAEGAMQFEGGARLGYEWKGLSPYLQAGLLYQDEGRASLLPWHLGVQYNYKAFLAGFEFYGQEVLKKDSKSDDPRDKQTVVDYADGGSYKFYYIDPAYYEARAYVGANILNKVEIRLGLGQTLMGKNSAAGQTYLLSAVFNFGVEKSDPRQDRFEAAPESYDQKLFKDEVVPNPRAPKKSNALDKEFEKIQNPPPAKKSNALDREFENMNSSSGSAAPAQRNSAPVSTQKRTAPVAKPAPKPKSNALEKEFETMKVQKPRPTKKEIQQKQMLDDVERELERKK